jgi:hypothetical protein
MRREKRTKPEFASTAITLRKIALYNAGISCWQANVQLHGLRVESAQLKSHIVIRKDDVYRYPGDAGITRHAPRVVQSTYSYWCKSEIVQDMYTVIIKAINNTR